MPTVGVFIEHRVRPGRRDDVFAVWKTHLAPAISTNPGHLDYFYGFADADADVLLVFQRYMNKEAASAFLQQPSYKAYLAEIEPLLQGPPVVRTASIKWAKSSMLPT